jgi:hypothetical protein
MKNSFDELPPTPEGLAAGDGAAKSLIEHMKWLKAAGRELKIHEGIGGWVITIEYVSKGSKPKWRPLDVSIDRLGDSMGVRSYVRP